MIRISLPGREWNLNLKNLLLDLNGTLAVDGVLSEGVEERINLLKKQVDVYLLTADTFGLAKEVADRLGIKLLRLDGQSSGLAKRDFLNTLGAEETVAIGNGYNDTMILREAGFSIVVIGGEGCCVTALKEADIAVTDINDALDLLLNPLRIVATL
ncbi:MAG: HAD family hydrolase, partial [Syntrophomonadaceae bacterium]|nr:HAD family hydrolase [Syntrophomonadaceae bacterium]